MSARAIVGTVALALALGPPGPMMCGTPGDTRPP